MIQLDYGVWLVTRAEWGARAPTSVTALSVDTDTDHWGGPGFGAPFPHSSCPAKVRAWQNFHMDARGWSDIAYNAVACPHGYLFEGRGRGRRSAANGTTAGNSGSYATCYLGGEGDEFTEDAKRAMRASGNWLTRAGSRRLGHRDWKSTACPGDAIYGWVHAGQPIVDVTPPPLPPPPAVIGEHMRTFQSATGGRPWCATSDNGSVVLFTATPDMAAPYLGPGDQWAPNEEWHAAVAAGLLEVVMWDGLGYPAKAVANEAQYDQARALVRRLRAVEEDPAPVPPG